MGFRWFYEKLFQIDQTKNIDSLKGFLVNEIIYGNLAPWGIGDLLHKLINFSDSNMAFDYLCLIKEKMPNNIYADVIYYIHNSDNHILNNLKFSKDEYNTIFRDEILKKEKREKKIEAIKNEIELVNNNDFALMLDNKKMIGELVKIHDFISCSTLLDDTETNLHKIYNLNHSDIINSTLYQNIELNMPIFSECAIKIMADYYKLNIHDINSIIEHLQHNIFKHEYFYIYFFLCWISIKKNQKADDKKIVESIKFNTLIMKKINDSINIDIQNKFINISIKDFQYINRDCWLVPFLYYYEHLLDKTLPRWMKAEHILKLIATPNPHKIVYMNNGNNIRWITDIFWMISSEQIIEYGLHIIDTLECPLSRIQIVEYFIDYYNTSKNNDLKEKILNLTISLTKILFDITSDNTSVHGEFQNIGLFWRRCNINYIENIFSKLTTEVITSALRNDKEEKKDINYQYRKMVLQYCIRESTIEQKIKMIYEIEKDMRRKKLSTEEILETHAFLASLGRGKSIKMIIISYINGKSISWHGIDEYPLGHIEQKGYLLVAFIKLLIYSNEKDNDRRSILHEIAKKGIKEQLNRKNFMYFKYKITKEIKKMKKTSNWLTKYYKDYLLQLEQSVFL